MDTSEKNENREQGTSVGSVSENLPIKTEWEKTLPVEQRFKDFFDAYNLETLDLFHWAVFKLNQKKEIFFLAKAVNGKNENDGYYLINSCQPHDLLFYFNSQRRTYVVVGDMKDEVHITNKFKTFLILLKIFQGKSTVVLSKYNTLPDFLIESRGKSVHAWYDSNSFDEENVLITASLYKLQRNWESILFHLPSDGEENIYSTFDELFSHEGESVFLRKIYLGWVLSDYPQKLLVNKNALTELTKDFLPETLSKHTFSSAEKLGVPAEMVAIPLLSALGSVIGSRLSYKPLANNNMTVKANLWGMVIANSGDKKTPASQETLNILTRLQAEKALERQEKLKKNASRINILKQKILSAEKQAAKESDPTIFEESCRTIDQLNLQLEVLQPPEIKYVVNTFTIEKLIKMHQDNPSGFLCAQDEMSGLFSGFYKKGHETDRSFLNTTWDGFSSWSNDTLSRGNDFIPTACLTLYGSVQPSIISKIVASMIQGRDDDGFLQRFQLLAYPNNVTGIEFEDKAQDLIATEALENLFRRILELPLNHKVLNSSEEAYLLALNYMKQHQRKMSKISNPSFRSYHSKSPKLVFGLALIFQVCEDLENGRESSTVGANSLGLAIRWYNFLEKHAKKLYFESSNNENSPAYQLALKIRSKKVKDNCTKRDIYKKCWFRLSKDEVDVALAELERIKWLTVETTSAEIGRPPEKIKFNKYLEHFLSQNYKDVFDVS